MHPFNLTNLAKDRHERLLADAAEHRLCAQPGRRRWRARRSPPQVASDHPCSPVGSSLVASSLVMVAS